MPMETRVAAARAIGQVLAGKSLSAALPPLLEKVAERDRGLLQQLCYGTLRQYPRLGEILGLLLEKPLRDKDRDVQGLLLVGLYQINDTRIPPHAAVSETVAATRGLKKAWARGLVNALLRRYLREGEQMLQGLEEAAAAAHPAWLYRELLQQWPEDAPEIISANNRQPPMSLRLHQGRVSRDEYLDTLKEQGIEADAGLLSPQCVRLRQARDVAVIPGFPEGMVSVQDEAAQMAAHLLQAAADDRVLDACAAPGGKACHILELQPQLEELVATDVAPERLQRVRDNLSRLQLEATTLTADAAKPPAELAVGSFDRILVDAPCSGSGVIRRHPDIKLLRKPQDIPALAQRQLEILQGLWPLLKAGGLLVYATCSILEEENSAVVKRFLAQCDDASMFPPPVDWGRACSHGRQLLPTREGPDGLFYALLRKSPVAR